MKHEINVTDNPRISSDTQRDVSGALLDAFRDLLLERGYDRLTVRDLIFRARVARSTFYEYFADKNDIFRHSIRPLFSVLAECVAEAKRSDRVASVLHHFWLNRRFARVMLRGSARTLMVMFLAEEIERCVARRQRSRPNAKGNIVPLHLATIHVAGAQLALIEGWIYEQPDCDPATVAQALLETSNAMIHVLLRG